MEDSMKRGIQEFGLVLLFLVSTQGQVIPNFKYLLTSTDSIGQLEYCFTVESSPRSYLAAKANCESKGGYLAVDSSPAVHTRLTQIMTTERIDEVWIGGQQFDWIWIFSTGQALGTYNNWDTGEPKNDDCAYSSPTQWKWRTLPCQTTLRYVCQRVTPSCSGTPTAPAFTYNSVCYSVYTTRQSWFSAQEECRKLGGTNPDLASIDSAGLMSTLELQLTGAGGATNGYWMGLTKTRWRWPDGSKIANSYWEGNHPVTDSQRRCLQLKKFIPSNSAEWLWTNNRCNEAKISICQIVNQRIGTTVTPAFISSTLPTVTPTTTPRFITPSTTVFSSSTTYKTPPTEMTTEMQDREVTTELPTTAASTAVASKVTTQATKLVTGSTTPSTTKFVTGSTTPTTRFITTTTVPPPVCPCQKVRVSAPRLLTSLSGGYTLEKCLHNGRNVYKHNNRDVYIYYDDDDQQWRIGTGLGKGKDYIRANGTALLPTSIRGTWEAKVELSGRDFFVNENITVDCACLDACERVEIVSTSESASIPGEFLKDGTSNGRPSFKHVSQDLVLELESSSSCAYWSVGQTSGQTLMVVNDVAETPDAISGSWNVHYSPAGADGWSRGNKVVVRCLT